MVQAKPPQSQEVATNILDWDRAALRVAQAMQAQGYFPTPADPTSRTFHVRNTAPGSTFLSEVGQALQGEILRRGGQLAPTPAAATTVNLEANVIQWSVNSGRRSVTEAAWGATILAQGGGVGWRYRDQFYLPAEDVPLYASAMTLPPAGPDTSVAYAPLRPVRLVR